MCFSSMSLVSEDAGKKTDAGIKDVNSDLSGPQKALLFALDKAEKIGVGGTAVRLYNDVIQRGRTEAITAKDLNSSELDGLKEIVLAKAQKTGQQSGVIDYKDYNSKLDSNILGGFKYKIQNNKLIVDDVYDFNANRADKFEDNRFMQGVAFLANPRGLAAGIGRKRVSDTSGKGVPVKIELNLE